jgi:transposase InsO family protein
MSKARLVITAVTIEKRPVSEVAKSYGVARSWIYTLLARYEAEGEAAFEPRSRRPRTSPAAIAPDTAGLIVRLRNPLASGQDTEILTWLDDHSRYALSLTAHHRVTGPAVLLAFRAACDHHGIPASTLTGNGMVFTTRLSGGRGGRNALEHELRRLGIRQKNGKPNHPQTQGKVERFQQTMKNWLRAQPCQPATLADLQSLLDTFAGIYNTQRPHRSLPGRATPAAAYAARPKANPGDRTADTHDRVRTDRIDHTGLVTLRHNGKLHHIGIGRAYAGTRVLLLVQDLDIRAINADTGELIRELLLNPDRDYQPTGKRPGWPKKNTADHT